MSSIRLHTEDEVDRLEAIFDNISYVNSEKAKGRKLTPHCDCEQANKAAGITKNPYRFRTNGPNHEIPWQLVPVKANAKGRCSHCGYEVIYQEVEDASR